MQAHLLRAALRGGSSLTGLSLWRAQLLRSSGAREWTKTSPTTCSSSSSSLSSLYHTAVGRREMQALTGRQATMAATLGVPPAKTFASLFDKLAGREGGKKKEASSSSSDQTVPENAEVFKANKEGEHVQIQKPQDFAKCVLRQAPIGPKKLKKFCDMVRGMSVEEALLQCRMSVKKAGKIVEKAVLSVRSNASHNHGLDQSKLYLAQIYAGKGRYRKTVDQKAKGRSVLKKKYYSHLTVIVKEGKPLRSKIKLFPNAVQRRERRMTKTSPVIDV